jgi:2-phosphosulfolactate phosphatase
MTAAGALPLITKDRNAVVIDVLRASSVMVTALNNGAAKIAAFKTIEETVAYKDNNVNEQVLLCGERHRVRIDGFDLGNSPIEYTRQTVSGRTIAMTTTNGTLAVENAKSGCKLYIMSFLNTQAVCAQLIRDNRDTVIVCAGTEGKFTLDDFVCAGKAVDILAQKTDLVLDDGAYAAHSFFIGGNKDCEAMVSRSSSYRQVINTGFYDDALFCLKQDVCDIAPVYRDGFIYAKYSELN